MITSIDGVNKIIDLDDSPTEDVQVLYSEFANAHNQNNDWLPAFNTLADLPRVPVYLFFINDWKIRMESNGTPYIKTFVQGFLIPQNEGGDPFTTNGGVEPRVRYSEPVLAVGYDSGGIADTSLLATKENQEIINNGIKRSSLLIPHKTDVIN
tara:strand:- start:16108 stop:16566 length:459 start_codon:yes stop_codon:yes gene_type:complete